MFSGLFIGLLLGVVLQRGQFCLSGQLRRIVFQRNLTALSPLLLVISIQSVGFFVLSEMGLIRLPQATMPILATLLGAWLFGVGMGVANRCVSGQLYRAGEGMIAAWVTLMVFALTTTATQTGILKFWVARMLDSQSTLSTIPQTMNCSPLLLIVPLCTFALWASIKSATHFVPIQWLKETWSPHFTAVLLGLVSIVAWYSSSLTGREFGLSFSVPLGNALQYVELGQQRYLNWGTYLVIGTVLGSLISAWYSGQLIWKMLTPIECAKSVIGGVLMAIGAALAGGCTMANAVVSTAYFSWQGWTATLMMMLGVWCVFILHKNPLESTC